MFLHFLCALPFSLQIYTCLVFLHEAIGTSSEYHVNHSVASYQLLTAALQEISRRESKISGGSSVWPSEGFCLHDFHHLGLNCPRQIARL
jgi:hypothetical protein